MGDGLLRSVAELIFGGQTDENIGLARGWIQRRGHLNVGLVVEILATQVRPLVIVDKSPSTVYRLEWMRRAYRLFPEARFLHLVRNPHGHAESVLRAIDDYGGPATAPRWLVQLTHFPSLDHSAGLGHFRDASGNGNLNGSASGNRKPDPQYAWFNLHSNILNFLSEVPDGSKLRVRAEDIVTNPDRELPQVVSWLGLRTDDEAIERMKHPERSPYACFGPPSAPFGNDPNFLRNPVLRPSRARLRNGDDTLYGREGGDGLTSEVRALADVFGYS